MANDNKLIKGMSKVFQLGLPALGVVLGGSWLADSIKVAAIKEICTLNDIINMPGAIIGLAVFSVSAAVGWHYRRKFLPVTTLKPARKPKPHAVLIWMLSDCKNNSYDPDNRRLSIYNEKDELTKIIDFTGKSLDQAIKEFSTVYCNWEPLLRGIEPHTRHQTLQHIYILGSSGTKSSHAQIDRVKPFLTHMLENHGAPELHTWPSDEGIDFEDLDELKEAIESITRNAREMKLSEKDIMIDCTGGQKTTSIAAALASLHHQNLEFQYVQTGGDKQVLSFNVITLAEPDIE